MRDIVDLSQLSAKQQDYATNLLEDIQFEQHLRARTELLIPETVAKLETLEEIGLVDEATLQMSLGHPLAVLSLVETIEDIGALPLEHDPNIDEFYEEWHARIYEKMLVLAHGDLGEVEPEVKLEADPLILNLLNLAEQQIASEFECADALMSPASLRLLRRKTEGLKWSRGLIPPTPRVA